MDGRDPNLLFSHGTGCDITRSGNTHSRALQRPVHRDRNQEGGQDIGGIANAKRQLKSRTGLIFGDELANRRQLLERLGTKGDSSRHQSLFRGLEVRFRCPNFRAMRRPCHGKRKRPASKSASPSSDMRTDRIFVLGAGNFVRKHILVNFWRQARHQRETAKLRHHHHFHGIACRNACFGQQFFRKRDSPAAANIANARRSQPSAETPSRIIPRSGNTRRTLNQLHPPKVHAGAARLSAGPAHRSPPAKRSCASPTSPHVIVHYKCPAQTRCPCSSIVTRTSVSKASAICARSIRSFLALTFCCRQRAAGLFTQSAAPAKAPADSTGSPPLQCSASAPATNPHGSCR